MSTAGKVLTVLILLAMVGWIVMLSAVTQLNVNWQTKIATAETSLTQAQDQIAKSKAATLDLTMRTKAEQTNRARDLREIQGRIAAAEGRLSLKTEDLTRLQFQVTDYQAAVERAKVNSATRLAEKTKALEGLAAKRVEIAQKQDENAKLRDQLSKLQTDFQRLLSSNAKQVRSSSGDRPAARPASDRRPPPAS